MSGVPDAITEEDLELFNDALERTAGDARLIERFYELFTADPEIAAMFEGIDMRVQRRKLRESLYAMLLCVRTNDDRANAEMLRLATLHARVGVPRRMYERWCDCLVAAARENDPRFDDAHERAFRRVVRRATDIFLEELEGGA